MRVLLDARLTVGPPHGIARHTRELVHGLVRLAPEVKLSLVVPPAVTAPWYGELPVEPIECRAPFATFREFPALRRLVRRARPDVYHSPSFLVPPTGGTPFVVTVHDLVHLAPGGRRLHRLYYRRFLPRRLRGRGAVLTGSETSAERIRRELGIPRERITVFRHALPPDWGAPEPEAAAARLESAGLPPRYILFVGNSRPHKNVTGAVRAWKEAGRPLPLVARCDPHPVLTGDSDLHRLDPLDEPTLRALYGRAEFLCMPSLDEGFGLPALEAMGCGCPVLASDRGSLPEVTGGAAWLLDPDDTSAWSEAMQTLTGASDRRREMSAAGLRRADEYRDHDAAPRVVLEVYRRLTTAGIER